MATGTVRLRIAAGSARPRVFRQMVAKTDSGVRHGDVVRIVDRDGAEVGEGFYNGRSEIAVRVLARPGEGPVDARFFRRKVEGAVRLRRDRLLDSPAMRVARRRLRGLTDSWVEIDDIRAVRQRANRLLETHPLRAGDSLQLAAALVLVSDRPDRVSFVTLDSRLAEAAEREGFDVVDVVPG